MKIKNEEPSKMQSDVYRKFGSVEEILVNNFFSAGPIYRKYRVGREPETGNLLKSASFPE